MRDCYSVNTKIENEDYFGTSAFSFICILIIVEELFLFHNENHCLPEQKQASIRILSIL